MIGIEAILALCGLIVPPAADFIKKKFLKREDDTAEATVSSLATTKPEVIPAFISAQVDLIKARIDAKNWDVIGTPAMWVVNLRAAIRPISVILSVLVVVLDMRLGLSLDENTRAALLLNISSWFGDRIK